MRIDKLFEINIFTGSIGITTATLATSRAHATEFASILLVTKSVLTSFKNCKNSVSFHFSGLNVKNYVAGPYSLIIAFKLQMSFFQNYLVFLTLLKTLLILFLPVSNAKFSSFCRYDPLVNLRLGFIKSNVW